MYSMEAGSMSHKKKQVLIRPLAGSTFLSLPLWEVNLTGSVTFAVVGASARLRPCGARRWQLWAARDIER